MTQTKIEWVRRKDGKQGYTWNPVYGCRNKCEYCYARRIANRFPDRFGDFNEPHLAPDNLVSPMPKIPSMIFVNSMSGLPYWQEDWWKLTIRRIERYPDHRFFFLTKYPKIYDSISFPDNCWMGVTITNAKELAALQGSWFLQRCGKKFLSIEPLLEYLDLYSTSAFVDWIIVGAETGNRKDKIIPEAEWIGEITFNADNQDVELFMKPGLKTVWGNDLLQEFPDLWESP